MLINWMMGIGSVEAVVLWQWGEWNTESTFLVAICGLFLHHCNTKSHKNPSNRHLKSSQNQWMFSINYFILVFRDAISPLIAFPHHSIYNILITHSLLIHSDEWLVLKALSSSDPPRHSVYWRKNELHFFLNIKKLLL